MAEVKDYLDIDEAGEYLGVGKSTLWGYVRKYSVPKYRMPLGGNKTYFKKTDLDALKAPRLKVGPKEAA